jgi:hypothetical protein
MADSEESVLVCLRVLDHPRVQAVSDVGRCGSSGCRIWIARSSPPTAHRWCAPCVIASDEFDEHAVADLTAAQIADIKKRVLMS